MKITKLLVLLLIFNLINIGKINAQSKIFNIRFPAETEKIDSPKVLDEIRRNFKHPIIHPRNKNTYRIGAVLISYTDVYSDERIRDPISSLEKQFSSARYVKDLTFIDSNTVKINSIKFVVINFQNNDEGYFHAFSDYYKNESVNILIQYKRIDTEKAKQILKDLLQSIKFKN